MTHWVTAIGGQKREFDAEITEQHPDERVAWKSRRRRQHAGVVTFHRLDAATTRVMVQMDFEPEGLVEKAGDKLGFVERRVKGDLERFKEFIESRGGEDRRLARRRGGSADRLRRASGDGVACGIVTPCREDLPACRRTTSRPTSRGTAAGPWRAGTPMPERVPRRRAVRRHLRLHPADRDPGAELGGPRGAEELTATLERVFDALLGG